MGDMGAVFRALHLRGDPVIIPNVWDAGTARIMEGLGARAVATTSAGYAFTKGRLDGGTITRDESLAYAQDIIGAVDIPVTGDFENGFGADPETVAETVRLAAEVGLAGCSIEDTDLPDFTPYGFDHSVERIRAAASAARALPHDFVLVARADGLMLGGYDLDEAIRRIQAYEAAGADCVYVPATPDMAAVERIVSSVAIPVNVLPVGALSKVPVTEFAALGAARITVGGALARVAFNAAIEAGRAILKGDFAPLTSAIPQNDINQFFAEKTTGDNDA